MGGLPKRMATHCITIIISLSYYCIIIASYKSHKASCIYDNPSISPFTIVMRSAWGDLLKPGIRMIVPAIATIISEPELMTRSRILMVKPVGQP